MKLALLLLTGLLWAQPQEPAFDVATVKHVGESIVTGPSAPVMMGCQWEPARVRCHSQIASLMQSAYKAEPWQVQGPDWIQTELYDIAATMPDGTSRDTAWLMMRKLLADRFALKFHTIQKEFPIYVLIAAPGGAKLKEVEKPAKFGYGIKAGHADDSLRFEGTPGIPLSAFVAYLHGPAGRPVIDETGLTGYYAFDVEWIRDPSDRKNAGILTTLGKIGLKLETRKRTYDVMVIDNAVKEPAEN
jgi:uncharacterized protein (TIGR03435 family)